MQSRNIYLKAAFHVWPATITSGISNLYTAYSKHIDKAIHLFKPVNKLPWKILFLFVNNKQFHSYMLPLEGAILPLSSIPTASYIFLLFSQHSVHLCGQPRSPTAEDQTKSTERFSAGASFRSPHLFLGLSSLATFISKHWTHNFLSPALDIDDAKPPLVSWGFHLIELDSSNADRPLKQTKLETGKLEAEAFTFIIFPPQSLVPPPPPQHFHLISQPFTS